MQEKYKWVCKDSVAERQCCPSEILSSCQFTSAYFHAPLHFKRHSELIVVWEFSSPPPPSFSPNHRLGLTQICWTTRPLWKKKSQIHCDGLTLSGMYTNLKVKPSVTKLSSSLFFLPVESMLC